MSSEITYEVNVSWEQPHPHLPKCPDGSIPLTPFADRPRRKADRREAIWSAEAAVVACRNERIDARGIEATVHMLRIDRSGEQVRVIGRSQIATVTEHETITYDDNAPRRTRP